ncbi:MAG TPA: carboxypeptidase regulatory-like domain-containing protein [Vicinamibacterales bacterium]|nr:carboxypeptidase regulatory-like domain-containing protein [Vicinamibacterales bacterium]
MRRVLRQHAAILLLALGLASMPSVSTAQVLGTVTGTVKDASGAVLPGVTVEASSPALIEKVRTAVTDGTGQYRIINLPPGAYVITFTLTGFSTVRREGVNLSINVTSTIDADMRVGAVQETITVTGGAPVVDLQSTAQTTVADDRTFKELPTGGSWVNVAQLIPAINSAFFGNRDVGGTQGDQTGTQVSVHGGIPGDGVSMIDGMRIGNMYLSSNLTNMSLSALIYDEVNLSFSGQMPESGTNGVIMNAIPKSGGNTFHGSLLANGSAPSLQGSNVNDRLRSRGASTTDSLKKLYDINGAIGGPIKRDKLWFYYTSRYFTNEYYLAGQYYAVDPSAFVRKPDLTRQAYAGTWTADNNIRFTWAPTVKQKISGWYAYQRKDDPHWLQQILFQSPEATQIVRWPTQLSTITWSYTATNKVLVEAGIAPGESPDTITQVPGDIAGVPIFELGGPDVPFNFAHRAAWFNDSDDRLPSQTFKGSVSYVTGSHSFKVGTQMQRGHFESRNSNHANADYYIISLNGAPLLATITSPLAGWVDRLNYNLGIYAQDSWTMKRLTLSGGVRLDFQNESVDAYHYGPGPWLPNRNVSSPEIKNVPNWKDIDPRINVAYDLFGTGKTALKGSVSRGVLQDSIGVARANDPAANGLVTSTSRLWFDNNGNRTPDCDLSNPAPQNFFGPTFDPTRDLCGPWDNANFGNPALATTWDPKILDGWGVRPYNWEYSIGVQREVIPKASVSAAFFRRALGNFWVTDNELVSRSDYTFYSATVPTNAGLPNSGQVITGIPDLNPNKLGLSRNVVKDDAQFGKHVEHFDGFDLTANGRFSNLILQGGISSGRRLTDVCDVRAQVPESSFLAITGQATAIIFPFCRVSEPMQHNVKGYVSYQTPWYGIRVSGTFQSVPGPIINAYNTYAGTAPGLGRDFSSGSSSVNLIPAWVDAFGFRGLPTGTQFGDRLNQFDLRFTKVVKTSKGSVDLDVDLYNAFNSDAILQEVQNYGVAWRNATSIIQPRFVKFAARWDF